MNKELCQNNKCTGFVQIQGLCWDCKLRYNTTNKELLKLREEVYNQRYTDRILATKIGKEVLRRQIIENNNVCEYCLE